MFPKRMNIRLSDEVALYNQELARADLGGARIVPLAIQAAAMWAVMTRLVEPGRFGISRLQKLMLYDGNTVECFTQDSVEEMLAAAPDEGSTGVTPRYVLDTFVAVARSQAALGAVVITPRPVLDALGTRLTQIAEEDAREYRELIKVAREDYHYRVKHHVQLALSPGLAAAERLCERYVRNLRGYVMHERVPDPATGVRGDPDEQFMRDIEEQINIPESRMDDFRTEIMVYIGALALDGKRFTPRSCARLFKACESKLFAEADVSGRLLRIASGVQDEQTQADRATAVGYVVAQLGYDQPSAALLVEYVAGTFVLDEVWEGQAQN